METEHETVVHVTSDAPWLPRGGIAEVIRRAAPPQPMCIARLLLRRESRVFCIPRPETGKLDLPMSLVEAGDLDGRSTIQALADMVVGPGADVAFIGAVRNRVESAADGYVWPTPIAHFGVWSSTAEPVIDGRWISISAADTVLHSRHWYPLVG